MEAGYKTGLFTSPHLKDFRERIKIDGKEIPEQAVVKFISENKNFLESLDLSFFEMTTGMAFDFFEKENVDIAVIETGLGGRLDSTNVITPILSIITNIGYDHMAILGDTLEKIAAEKAGIIKQGVPVVIGEYTAETKGVFEQKAAEAHSTIYCAADLADEDYPSDLKGAYQFYNRKTFMQAVRILRENGFNIEDGALRNGLMHVVKNTRLLGRWQQLSDKPKTVTDTAHNSHGLERVMKQVQAENFQKLHMVIGVASDKALDDILPLFPKNAIYYFCKPDLPRGLDAALLKEKAAGYALHGKSYPSVRAAFHAATENAAADDFIYIGGSTFVVAEAL
jgi:dihydrofolate synthase/folylpolyglutamate synthase